MLVVGHVVPELASISTVRKEASQWLVILLASTGQPIGRIDPLIAAIAVASDLELVTGNRAHYERLVESASEIWIGVLRGPVRRASAPHRSASGRAAGD
jgi:hypothetical protein